MSDRLDELGDETVVVLITFGDEDFSKYQSRHRVAFPILRDSERAVYRSYGLGRGSFWDVWGWSTITKYWSILRHRDGNRIERATEDTRQLGGDFIVAPDGTLARGFWADGPADRPSVDEIIAAVAAAR